MKKYTNNDFQNTKYGIFKSATDTITSFPSTIIANGQNASTIIKGNMQQSGTPTTTVPIYPKECGDLSSGNYIIHIICGGVTTSINLSEVQSTRSIQKLVLNGEESWLINESASTEDTLYLYSTIIPPNTYIENIGICSHFEYKNIFNLIEVGFQILSGYGGLRVRINKTTASTATGFKNYLAQQYANDTPVTVWYALATETTTTLNEPLRKIGEYADSVAASAIPTTAGAQTFNIGTTLKPSEVDLTYTGWHLYNDKKRTSGEWV